MHKAAKSPVTSVLRTGNKRNTQTQLKCSFIKIGALVKFQPSKTNMDLTGCSEVDCDKGLLSLPFFDYSLILVFAIKSITLK